jgi:hypothetical protein
MIRTIHLDDSRSRGIMGKANHRLRFAASAGLLACVSFHFGCFASAQQSSSLGIVGRWFSLERSKGRIGQLCEFRSNGTVDYSIGAIVDMPWRIENNQLTLPPATTDGPEQKYTLKWLGDNKLRLETEGSVTELARVGNRSANGNPIIGEWIENREMGGHNVEARWLFYARGKVLLLIPFAIQHGSYTISGSALHLKIPGLMKPEFRFKVADNSLTLSDPEGGQESHYARY